MDQGTRTVSHLIGTDGLKIFTGLILGGIGMVVFFQTNTSIGSAPALILSLSLLLGFIVGISDEIEPLRRAFERGKLVITSLSILFLLLLAAGPIDPSITQLGGFALGFGGGSVIGSISVVVLRTIHIESNS